MFSSPLVVKATRWKHGWELEIVPNKHYTQVKKLSQAEQQVRDYLDTVWPDNKAAHAELDIQIALQ